MWFLLSFTDGQTVMTHIEEENNMVVFVQLKDGKTVRIEGADDVGLMPGGFVGLIRKNVLASGADGGKVVAGFNAGDVIFYHVEGETRVL